MARKVDQKILELVKELISQISKDDIRIEKAYLFGSHAKGTADDWSDIDIALVSNDFSGTRYFDRERLTQYIIHLDSRLEIHPYRADEFNEDSRWFVKEILDTGIRIL
jgi:predicted nucleotidyltransferase